MALSQSEQVGHVRQQFRYRRGRHFFLQAVAKQVKKGIVIQPGSARNFYLALEESVRQLEEPWSFLALIAVAQAAYRLGQFYQRQPSRLAILGSS